LWLGWWFYGFSLGLHPAISGYYVFPDKPHLLFLIGAAVLHFS